MKTTTQKPKRFAQIDPGTIITIITNPGTKREDEQTVLFVGMFDRHMTPSGKVERRVKLMSTNGSGSACTEWELYKYHGQWSYGSSAERVQLGEVTNVRI